MDGCLYGELYWMDVSLFQIITWLPKKSRRVQVTSPLILHTLFIQTKLNQITIYTPNRSTKCPQTILFMLLDYRNRLALLKGARYAHPIKYSNVIICLFPNYKEKKGVHGCQGKDGWLLGPVISLVPCYTKKHLVANRLYSTETVSFIQLAPW